jgi:hypothetical protein
MVPLKSEAPNVTTETTVNAARKVPLWGPEGSETFLRIPYRSAVASASNDKEAGTIGNPANIPSPQRGNKAGTDATM